MSCGSKRSIIIILWSSRIYFFCHTQSPGRARLLSKQNKPRQTFSQTSRQTFADKLPKKNTNTNKSAVRKTNEHIEHKYAEVILVEINFIH